MNDKAKSKVDTKIEAKALKDEALGDEELENVPAAQITTSSSSGGRW